MYISAIACGVSVIAVDLAEAVVGRCASHGWAATSGSWAATRYAIEQPPQ